MTNDSEQKAQRKSTQKLGRKAVQRNGEKTVDGIEERVEDRVDERIEVRIGERTKGEDQREETYDGSVRCICACNMEKGEMVCCDMCEGWTHLRCLGMKEGVGGMVGKEYVCYFCVSACLLALRREVEGLRKELKEVREENGRMKRCLEQERLEDVRVTQVEMKENMPRCGKVAVTGDRLAERLEDVRVTQVEMKENMPRCGKLDVTGDRLAERLEDVRVTQVEMKENMPSCGKVTGWKRQWQQG